MLLHSELFFMFSCVFSMKNLWVLEGVPCRPPHPAGRLPSWQPPRQPRHRHNHRWKKTCVSIGIKLFGQKKEFLVKICVLKQGLWTAQKGWKQLTDLIYPNNKDKIKITIFFI